MSGDTKAPKGPAKFSRRAIILLLLLLILATAIAYLPATQAGFIWDDDRYVTGNTLLRSVEGLRQIWLEPDRFPQYYPMVLTSFWLEYQLWELEPFGYHVTNILLHASNAVLLWLVLSALAVPGAWLAAALFALHPVHVETAAWVTERKNLLSLFFVLSSVLAYCRFRGFRPFGAVGDSGEEDDRPRRIAYGLSLAFFLLALFCKTIVSSMPAAMLVLHWWKTGRVDRKEATALAPFFALGVTLGLVTVYMEKVYVGASGPEWSLSLLDRILIAGRALWFYAATLAWPAKLTFSYPRWTIDTGLWWQYLFPLAALSVMAILYAMRHRLGRGPLAAVLIFAGTLVPALGFFDVFPMRYSFVADHFQYFSSIALIALFPALLLRLMPPRHRHPHGPIIPLPALSLPLLLLLALLTWRQSHVYHDAETLWRDTIAKNPTSWMAHLNLGVLLLDTDRTAEAGLHFQKAHDLNSSNARALFGLGRVALTERRLDEAIDLFRESKAAWGEFLPARFTLANTLARRGDIEEARAEYLEILRIKGDYTEVYNNLGSLLVQMGDWNQALDYFAIALNLDPESARRHNNLGFAQLNLGRIPQAEASFREALRRKPDYGEAYVNLGSALLVQGRLGEAEEQLMAALRINPGHGRARAYLEEVRLKMGR